MGLYAKVLDRTWCQLFFVSQFCRRIAGWLAVCLGTTFVPSFTVKTAGEFLSSVTCFVVVWALHICKTQLFFSPINTDAEQADALWNGWDICVGGWELRLNHRALCPSLLSSQSVFQSTWVSSRQLWEWYLGQPSDLWGAQPTHFVCDTTTSRDTDIEELSVTPASISFFFPCAWTFKGISGWRTK